MNDIVNPNDQNELPEMEPADKEPIEEVLRDRALEYLQRFKPDMDNLQMIREKLHKEYMGEPYGNEQKGRSQVVMTDIADTIEWIMPGLMRIFFGGEDVCKISGRGPEDVDGAELLNEKVNFDYTLGFNGYLVFYDWFKDALLEKMGIVKFWWDRHEEYKAREYRGLDIMQYQQLKLNPQFVIDEETSSQNENTGFEPSSMYSQGNSTFDVKGREIKNISRPMVEVLPPEEFVFDIRCKSIKDSEFACHRKRMHKTEIMERYKVTEEDLENVPNDVADLSNDILYMERFKDLGGASFWQDEVYTDWKLIHECYLNDYSTGKKVPKQLVLIGPKVLELANNEYGRPPFCELTPIRIQHRAVGRGVGELVQELQKLRTSLWRFILDNIYYQNNAQKVVNPYRIELQDLLDNNHPGGIIRTKQDVDATTAVWPIPISPLPGHTFSLLEKIEDMKENRVGVTRYNMGTDASTLNKTATGVSAIMQASTQRIELIARMFAETGVKDLFYNIAQMNIDFLDSQTNLRLNNRWQLIDPAQLDVGFDVLINVALGTGSKDQQTQALLGLLDRLMSPEVISSGVFTPQNLYNVIKVVMQNLGYKNTSEFLTEPPPQMMGGPNAQGVIPPGQPGPPSAGGPVGRGPAIPGQ